MERRTFIALLGSAAAAMPSPASAGPPQAARGNAERISGTWAFVSSVDTRKDGSIFNRWGDDAKGALMIDAVGHYSLIIMGSESRIFGGKTFCSFGTYAYDDTTKLFATQVEGSSISRLIGAKQQRKIVSLTADELVYVNPVTTAGTQAEVKWKRLG
jgi:hypothetical protein